MLEKKKMELANNSHRFTENNINVKNSKKNINHTQDEVNITNFRHIESDYV
jgi:hypothetical protein